ncbi:YdcF family protein [Sphingomonas donggukensis]|uniref:YdcF family protein n=1 Tax=Sphingomonas donggukensis TaxID=2949093 RepID=A0ABY4TSN0_9SPHN|nr:YdcF family protein [Sphingomonas donggukensis]URW75292.1 YdcF family protein [Sphingomonas donggukensis]
MRRLIVVFGAAVRADGSASPTLARRIAIAERAVLADDQNEILCSGAVGDHPPSEAAVMAALLARSIDPARIHRDDRSRDTLQTVAAAVAFTRAHGFDRCVACTDRYHLPRVRMLFWLFGMPGDTVSSARGEHRGSRAYLTKMRLREAAALPYDLVAGAWAVRRAARRRR